MTKTLTKTGGRAETSGVIPGDYALSVGNPKSPTPKGWAWKKLTDIARLETGHTPSRKHPEYWGGDVPWIGIKDATSSHGETLQHTNQYTNDLGIQNSSARILPQNTVCLSRTASVGYVVVMGIPMATSQDFVNWVCDPEELDFRFLKYVLLSEGRSFLRFASGTTHQTIYFPEVKAFHICLPHLDEQNAIAHILGTLDDKIELNRQMNATLESMAQVLFKSWFVDFDPVIDNAIAAGNPVPETLQARADMRAALVDLRRPLPEAIREQFPSRFVFTEEMGWVPEGWSPAPLDQIANYKNGLALQNFRPENDNDYLPVVKIAQLRAGYANGQEKASPNIIPGCIIDDGDVVFSWSGSLMVEIWCGGRAALNQHLFKVTSELYPKWFYYQYTCIHLQEFQRIAADKAVTMGHIKREHLSQATCAAPTTEILHTCSVIFEPLMSRSIKNRMEIRQLERLRDTLLPRLLSGQLRIPDAEKHLAEAI